MLLDSLKSDTVACDRKLTGLVTLLAVPITRQKGLLFLNAFKLILISCFGQIVR
jgi:hypothetical protein